MHLSRAVAASLTSIILPLYQYPPSSTACWPALTKALEGSNATTTPWLIIVNPDSGPTSDKTDLYLRCLPALRETGANVKLVGYVATGYGKKSPAHVRKEVMTYQAWANLTVAVVGGNDNTTTSRRALHKVVRQRKAIPLDGIFFDEVPTQSQYIKKYAEYAGLIKQGQWNNGTRGEVVFNPGTSPNQGFFSLADIVVTFEDAYRRYSTASLAQEASRASQGVIIYAVPSASLKSTAMVASSSAASATRDKRWQWHAEGAMAAYVPGAAMKDPLPAAPAKPAPNVVKVPASHPSLDAILDDLIPSDPTTAAVGAVFVTTDTLPNPYDPLDKRSLTALVSGLAKRNAARLAAS